MWRQDAVIVVEILTKITKLIKAKNIYYAHVTVYLFLEEQIHTHIMVKKIKKVKVATSGEFKKGSKFVPCSVCGKQKFCRQDVYDARVAKFGSEKKMLSSYVCRDCKTKQKPVK